MMRFDLEEKDVKTILHSLKVSIHNIERHMTKSRQKGFVPAPGKLDKNVVQHAEVSSAIRALNGQIRNQQRNGR